MSHASRILDLVLRAADDKGRPALDGVTCSNCLKLTAIDQHAVVKVVHCLHCNKLHKVNSNGYLTFEGNVYVGTGSGLIGNNFGEDGRVERVSVICRSLECLGPLLGVGEEFIGG